MAGWRLRDGLDVVASLVDQSLVWREEQPDGEPRLRLLETIPEYAREQLGSSADAEATRARYAEYYVDLAERAAIELVGPLQQTWFARLERERDNLRAVERWATARSDAGVIVRLGAALWPFWLAREDAAQARERLETLLPFVGLVPPDAIQGRALHGIGLVAEKLGEYALCRSLFEQGLAVARQLDDRRTLALLLDSLGRQMPRHAQAAPPIAPSAARHVMTPEQAVEECLAWLAMPTGAAEPRADGLTRRERDVVALLALGQTNRQIAAALVLTEGTVENYVQRILGKLGVNNRAQIAIWAVAHGHGR